MPTNTSLTINSTKDGKKVTDKISYVNPNITDKQAVLLAQTLNSLSNNSYVSAERTDITELNAQKALRNFASARFTTYGNKPSHYITFDEGDDYTVDIPLSEIQESSPTLTFWARSNSFNKLNIVPQINTDATFLLASWRSPDLTTGGWANAWTFDIKLTSYSTQTLTFKVAFPADDTYDERELNFTINITEDPEP